MAEYIERESVIKELKKQGNYCFSLGRTARAGGLYNAADIVEYATSADVVEVRHGEWVKDTRIADVCAEYRCSFCGFMYCEADPKYPPYKYCPECGSKNE